MVPAKSKSPNDPEILAGWCVAVVIGGHARARCFVGVAQLRIARRLMRRRFFWIRMVRSLRAFLITRLILGKVVFGDAVAGMFCHVGFLSQVLLRTFIGNAGDDELIRRANETDRPKSRRSRRLFLSAILTLLNPQSLPLP